MIAYPSLITVAVGGRYALDCAGLSTLLERLPGLRVVPKDARPPPHVLVWVSDAPDEVPPLAPDTAVLLVVGHTPPTALPTGVAGLFSKDEPPEALGLAIRQVARGDQYLSSSLALTLLQQHPKTDSASPQMDLTALTERERDVLRLLGEGLSNKAIAARLYLSVRTVEGHLASLYAHLGVHSRTEAALIALHHGLTSPGR